MDPIYLFEKAKGIKPEKRPYGWKLGLPLHRHSFIESFDPDDQQ